ncbi:MAG: rhombosortase [Shewanella sp.]|nr:rhombosortase [Shewanella sp.]
MRKLVLKTLTNYFRNTASFGLSISIISVSLYLLGLMANQVDSLLSYQRLDIQAGDVWQLITGNLLHTNHWHLIMNLAGLWVILSLHDMHYSTKRLWVIFSGLCLLEGLGLFFFYPSLLGYVGLSGVLHGFFAFGAIADIKSKMTSGWLLLIGLIAKVSYEQVYGASADVTAMIGARVATESHLVGAISGLIIIATVTLISKK